MIMCDSKDKWTSHGYCRKAREENGCLEGLYGPDCLYKTFTPDTINFKIELFNSGDQITFTKIFDYFSHRYAINIVNSGEIVKIVLSSSGTLALLEFEALGDCTKRRYGADCEEICSITCADQDCQFNGVCKECVQKRTGDFCMESLTQVEFFKQLPSSQENYISTPKTFALSLEHILTIPVPMDGMGMSVKIDATVNTTDVGSMALVLMEPGVYKAGL
ncbi:uncharacterized protein LOC131928980, partial [Physella acuta]|uniref:uncharacterized protein LOC131928980 n=1 Tax=Physella acuta TaxID=109671 RepID=UPI0027DB2F40